MFQIKIKALATVLLAVLFFSMAFRNAEEEKIITIKFKEAELGKLYEAMEFSKQAIQTSTAPAVQVGQVIGILNDSQKIISDQYKAQTDTTKKAPIKK